MVLTRRTTAFEDKNDYSQFGTNEDLPFSKSMDVCEFFPFFFFLAQIALI